MLLADVRKKLIGWIGKIFATVGIIVGLAGIGCLAVGYAFTLTGIGGGIGIPLMIGGLIGLGIGAMTTSLSLISLWMGEKEDSKPTNEQASSDIPTDVPTIAASSPKEIHSNSKLSRFFSFIWALFKKGTSKVATIPVITPRAAQQASETIIAPTQKTNAESLMMPAKAKRKEILEQLYSGGESPLFSSSAAISIEGACVNPGARPEDSLAHGAETSASPKPSLADTRQAEKAQKAFTENKPPEIDHDSLIRVFSLFAPGKTNSESLAIKHLDRRERLMLHATNRDLRNIFGDEFKPIIEAKKEGLFCYCVDVPLSLRDVGFKMTQFPSKIFPMKPYMPDIRTIMARTALAHSGSEDDLTYARFIGGMGSEIGIYKLTENAFCRKYICDRTGFDIGFPNHLTDFNVKHPEGSLLFYHNGIPMGFFVFCKVGEQQHERIICLNRNVTCKVLLDMFSQAKKLGLFDKSRFWNVYTGEFMCFVKRTFCFNYAESNKVSSDVYAHGHFLCAPEYLDIEAFIGVFEAYSNHEHFSDKITMHVGKTIKLIRDDERATNRELREARLEEHPLLDMAKINDIIKKQTIKVRRNPGNNVERDLELVIKETKANTDGSPFNI